MNLTTWLDVGIGLGVVYLGASLFVTILGEYVSQALNLRGRALFESLGKLIADPSVREKLAAHPALQPFFGASPKAAARTAPSYVDPNVLARALLAVGTAPGAAPALPASIQELFGAVEQQASGLVASASQWLDASLTMLSERYKRWIRWVTFGLGVAVAVALNLDTVAITVRLYADREARDSVAAVAAQITSGMDATLIASCAKPGAGGDPRCAPVILALDGVQRRNDTLGKLPIGWPLEDGPGDWRDGLWRWSKRLVGWLLTALALSLGAPFWFDLLARLVNVRHGMPKPQVAAAGESAAPSPAAAPAVVTLALAPDGGGALRTAAGKDDRPAP